MRFIVFALLICVPAAGQAPGTFTPAGNLTTARELHTATLLPDGKVLVAGGSGVGIPTLAGAELYDPSTRTFTAIGDMTTPRSGHTATLLPSGKVLIAGGSQGPSALASAELYDPASGTFAPTGSMTVPRGLHTATLLPNGKVLLAGGSSGTQAELYDPSAGTFNLTGDMTEPGADTATLLPNGKILITRSVQFWEESQPDLYDPATGTFTRTGDLIDPKPGQQPTATLLFDGKVLIAGGSLGDFGGSASAEIYDPATGAFTNTGKMTTGIDTYAAATLLPEGRVLIAGRGDSGVPCPLTHIGPPITITCPGAAELYDPAAGTFGAPVESQSMEGHAATLLADGTVLLTGGFRCCGITIATAEIYHPAVLVPSPVLYSLSGNGQGQGAILHAGTARPVTAGDPTVAGEALEIYCAGLKAGSVIPPQVAIGGQPAGILFFGEAPGFTGLNQVNVRVPAGVDPGPAVPVRLTYLGRPSNVVTIGLEAGH